MSSARRSLLLLSAALTVGCASAPQRDEARAPAAMGAESAAEAAPAEEAAGAEAPEAGVVPDDGVSPVAFETLPILRTDASDATIAARYGVNPTVDVRAQPLVTTRPQAADASLSFVRDALARGRMPDPALVRPEQIARALRFLPPGGASIGTDATFALQPSPYREGYTALVVAFTAGVAGLRAANAGAPVTVLVDVSGRDDASLAAARAFVDALQQRTTTRVVAFGNGGAAGDALTAGPAPVLAEALAGARGRVFVLARGALSPRAAREALARLEAAQPEPVIDVVGFVGSRLRDDGALPLADATGGRYRAVHSADEARALASAAPLGEPAVRDLVVEARFDDTTVERYRVLGYDGRTAAGATRGVRARGGTLYGGEQVVIVYELKLRSDAGRLGVVDVRWHGGNKQLDVTSSGDEGSWAAVAQLAAAAFGEKLRGGWWSFAYDYDDILEPLTDGDPEDTARDDVRALRTLVEQAKRTDRRPVAQRPDGDRVPARSAP